jgi:predicted PurR-regulated permease PerM
MPSVHTRHRIHLASLFLAVLLVATVLYAGRAAEIVLIAALLAYILDPVVTAIEVRGFSRGVAASCIMLAIIAATILFWYTVIPIAIDQFRAMQTGPGVTPASKALARLQVLMQDHGEFLGLGTMDLAEEFAKLKTSLAQRIPVFILRDSPSLLIGLLMIPFVMFFLLKDIRMIKKYFISLVPNRYFEFTLDLMYKMDIQLGNYLRGQFIDALVFGVLATAALWILGVPYFVFIGIFAGLANLIPFVGPVVGAIAALIAVILERGDVVHGAYVLLAFALLKGIDDFLLQPLVVGKNVHLHPMVVALGILVGGHLFGVLGMLLVVPFMGFLKVVMEESIETYRRYRFD